VGDEPLRVAEQAIAVFERLQDDGGLARAWRHLSSENALRCQFAASETASERALEFARRAGDMREESRSADRLCTALLYGPAPVDGAIARCEAMLQQAGANALLTANIRCALAGLAAMDARFSDAREDAAAAERTYSDLGLRFAIAGLTQVSGQIELLAGDAIAAEGVLRRGYEILHRVGVPGISAALLAEALYAQGRFDVAAEVAAEAEASAASHDTATRVIAIGVAAKISALGGDGEAEARAAAAVGLARQTDATNLIGEALVNHALALQALGLSEKAGLAAAEAGDAFQSKGNRAALQALASLFARAGV
jgi:hypothetical protein